MSWIRQLSPELDEDANALGSKAFGLVVLLRLGLPVPPAFVIGTAACRAFLRDGRPPDGLVDEVASAITALPGAVSVRSGAAVSMPGMMSTILNVSTDIEPIMRAIETVFSSWNTPRAQTYRTLHGIPHDSGTAVVVQAMVYGDRDEHSGSGVAFSRNPNTGERIPYGDVLFGRQGEAVVSGRSTTAPLSDLQDGEPAVWQALLDALGRIEAHYRDACSVEFTFESGRLWLLQVRSGGLVGRAAVRVAVELVDEGVIDRGEAVARVSPKQLAHVRTPRLDLDKADVLARGIGASPGVAIGKVATTADAAVRMAADGPVILVRPETSPLDLHGLAAAAGVVTAKGGPTSHAAVVARSMGKPAVVGATGLALEDGTLVSIDGTGGEVVRGHAAVLTDEEDPHVGRLLAWAEDARSRLRKG
ncbi:PEP/pyruvate-binding domain-containing protein [Tenggerimyces flavus]|uniref:PEP/pyruvate-binding domain-containing protein n=1 Tax=Tenggerimyces flavus TaxID=1708749 RepID=A0ABV7YKJ6_9ACTN|nr:PEP/pyruvate-binding domain-containing protein [Tenggerimyces flavus]MBM7784695.1 phosphoenolpyruvate synthase/pyruvate phosphate dikinase [Tenggerimyces flavus]